MSAETSARLEAAEAAAWKLYEALLNAICRTELGTQRRTEALHAWIAYDQDYDRYDGSHADGQRGALDG